MGGSGSGRSAEKYCYTVEDCNSIDVNRWNREGIIQSHIWRAGNWIWYADKEMTEKRASIGYEGDCEKNTGYVRLHYTWRDSEKIDYRVRLATTPVYFGGFRWWFVCPNTACGKRVGKLYLAPNSKYFLCRSCQKLTYTSCRESHKLDGLYNSLARYAGLPVFAVKKGFKEMW